MATFPTDATILVDGYAETPEPGVIRTPTEGGMIKQRKRFSRSMVQRPIICTFASKTTYASFLTWYESTINRVDWFDFTDPRTGATLTARIAGGKIEPEVDAIVDRWLIKMVIETWGF